MLEILLALIIVIPVLFFLYMALISILSLLNYLLSGVNNDIKRIKNNLKED